MKKILTFMLVLMLLTLPALAENYNIGICQLVQHVALDDASRGFADAIADLMGDKASVDVQNASGETATCISIMNAFIAEEMDLIVANATPALQAAFAATGAIPVLGMSVTDYPSALDMDQWNGVTGVNVSGTSDLAPLGAQAGLIEKLFPEARQIGLLYCTSEVNSIYQVEIIEALLTELGYSCSRFGFTDSNDVASVAQSACAGSDVVFVPTDNVVAACAEAIRNVVEIEQKPIVGGDEGICAGCGVATICINYYDLGYATGRMAVEILENGADVSAMPIEFSPKFYEVYNGAICDLLGVEVPEGAEII